MPQSLHSPGILPAEILAEAVARANRLCFDAQIIRSKAAAQVADSKRGQAERRRWRAVWSASREKPDHVMVCCAYCARFRTPGDGWGAIPAGLRQAIQKSARCSLSHGICPDCLARHSPS
jgi:hypothetical protein